MCKMNKSTLNFVQRPLAVISTALLALFIIGFGSFSLASAKEPGTLHAFPASDWALALSDQELGAIRGGVAGVSFEVFSLWFAEVSKQGDLTDGLVIQPVVAGSVGNPGGVSSQPFGINNGEVNLITEIGNFNGGSGIFQIVQVPGSDNIINNNLFINITVNGGEFGQLPLGSDFLGR
jgi:hypothetical protein